MKRTILSLTFSTLLLGLSATLLAADEVALETIQSDVSEAISQSQKNADEIPALTGGLPAERTAREAADANLQSQIDAIQLLPGPPGPQGPQGEPGPQGPAGPATYPNLLALDHTKFMESRNSEIRNSPFFGTAWRLPDAGFSEIFLRVPLDPAFEYDALYVCLSPASGELSTEIELLDALVKVTISLETPSVVDATQTRINRQAAGAAFPEMTIGELNDNTNFLCETRPLGLAVAPTGFQFPDTISGPGILTIRLTTTLTESSTDGNFSIGIFGAGLAVSGVNPDLNETE